MVNRDMQCPYCGEWQEVCHDDGQGYDEDDLHEHECSNCEKNFLFRTSITFHYYPKKADCLNGADHTWKKQLMSPYYPDRKVCTICGKVDVGKWHEWEL